MSDYGMKIYDSSSGVTLDVADRITRLRYSNLVAAGSSDSVVLGDISGLLSVEFGMTVIVSPSTSVVAHDVSRSGTTISWTAKSGTKYSSSDTIVFVFLYT